MHLWLGESTRDARLEWARSVDRVAQLGAKVVVAGHKKPGLPDDASALTYTKKYLDVFEKAASKSRSSAEVTAAIHSAFPNTIDVLDNFLLGNSSKVAMGEIPLWQE